MRAWIGGLAAAALIITSAGPRPAAAPSGHDWTRFGWDAGRSNAATDPTGITRNSLARLEKQQVRLEGTVDASPIYLSRVSVNDALYDVFFVTTSYGKTIAIDADAGSLLWTYTPANYDSWAATYQITNATPVADPTREFIYAASPDGYIQKLSVADGQVVWRTAITMLPQRERIVSPLNLFKTFVVATTASYLDAPPYQGRVILLDRENGRLVKIWNSLCSHRTDLFNPSDCAESGAAIWGRAGAVVDLSTSHLLVATGNGVWNGRTYWGDAVVELDEGLNVVGSYTPRDTNALDDEDLDVGSTSPVLLGGDAILQGGKDAKLRLLSTAQMRNNTPAQRGGERQVVNTPSGNGLFTAPAVMHTTNTILVFAADDYGTAAWSFHDERLHDLWRNRNPGTSPVVAGGLLYVYDPRGGLDVYEPRTGEQLATLDCAGGHWNSPIIADGRIALPEGSANDQSLRGYLDIWRLSR